MTGQQAEKKQKAKHSEKKEETKAQNVPSTPSI
jgi:hypothetical protein